MTKSSKKSKRVAKPTGEAVLAATHGSTRTLSNCYLEHAARETQWAADSSKQCDYQAAANALERRGVWLVAALIAQERKA
jgi:hypothetical protein